MYPNLVEYKIKNIINNNLQYCNNYKNKNINFIFNLCSGIGLLLVICAILYFKYKQKNNKRSQKIKEAKKRDYILYNLRKFKDINNKTITNIPLY
uniref:Uncharacterized protein n=1 Tax=Florenciella sp. virus SA2 TaxID=3240092 RepID=A0AB39JBM6_9VIRU